MCFDKKRFHNRFITCTLYSPPLLLFFVDIGPLSKLVYLSREVQIWSYLSCAVNLVSETLMFHLRPKSRFILQIDCFIIVKVLPII